MDEPASQHTGEELATLRRRLAAVERERAEQIAAAHRALAGAQDESYWLDRWGVDLNALMRRRGAAELRSALRAARLVYRARYVVRTRLVAIPARLRSARAKLEEERSRR